MTTSGKQEEDNKKSIQVFIIFDRGREHSVLPDSKIETAGCF